MVYIKNHNHVKQYTLKHNTHKYIDEIGNNMLVRNEELNCCLK